MFTGIVQDIGRIRTVHPIKGDICIHVEVKKLDERSIRIGDSVAVNGVCLTVAAKESGALVFDISVETLEKTTLSHLAQNQRVNLETALTPATALGGHWVSGHIDGIGELIQRCPAARSEQFTFSLPIELARYIAIKGSVCVDGVSLTVNALNIGTFDVTIVPHTLENTIFSSYQLGQRVNLEVDIIARYLERLLEERINTE